MTAPVALDRRQRRRLETIEEIVDVAVAVMSESGVGGLSLGEVARRMGMRTPSLYVYFDSKNALYDAVFTRGWQGVLDTMSGPYAGLAEAPDLPTYFRDTARHFVRWMLAHPVHAQLMIWRPVPGYQPSAEAYEPAVATLREAEEMFAGLQRRGLLRKDVAAADLLRTWTVLTSGVISQQLSNAPHESFDEGRFTRTLPDLVSMFLTQYGGPAHSRPKRTS
jgi:AcrR family transcriptional regulator